MPTTLKFRGVALTLPDTLDGLAAAQLREVARIASAGLDPIRARVLLLLILVRPHLSRARRWWLAWNAVVWPRFCESTPGRMLAKLLPLRCLDLDSDDFRDAVFLSTDFLFDGDERLTANPIAGPRTVEELTFAQFRAAEEHFPAARDGDRDARTDFRRALTDRILDDESETVLLWWYAAVRSGLAAQFEHVFTKKKRAGEGGEGVDVAEGWQRVLHVIAETALNYDAVDALPALYVLNDLNETMAEREALEAEFRKNNPGAKKPHQ